MAKVYLRGKVYYGDYWQGGKRIRKPLSENKRTAQDMLDDLLAAKRALRAGILPRDVSWRGFKERHKLYRESEKAEQTQYRDELAFRMLDRAMSVTHLHQITPEMLSHVVGKWKKDGYSSAAIARAVDSIKAAMHRAEDWKLIGLQNWRIVKADAPSGRLLYYTMEEYGRLLKKCRGHWLTAALLMGRAGMRSAETRHLHFEDLDWKDRTLWIRSKPCDVCKACKYGGNVWHPKGWKPKKPKERRVDMPDDLLKHLQALPMRPGLVLGPEIISEQVFDVYMRRLIGNAGLKGSSHTLRHTYASHLVSNGVSLEVVGELLGHEDSDSTKIYAHIMPHARRTAVDRLPALVAGLCQVPTTSNGMTRNGKD